MCVQSDTDFTATGRGGELRDGLWWVSEALTATPNTYAITDLDRAEQSPDVAAECVCEYEPE